MRYEERMAKRVERMNAGMNMREMAAAEGRSFSAIYCWALECEYDIPTGSHSDTLKRLGLWEEYKELRKLGLTKKECLAALNREYEHGL